MVELSVVGSFVNYWFPGIPAWVSAAFFLVVITSANLLGVKKFGEFEFWFAIIKITAVIAMIVGGLAVIMLALPTDSGIPASFAKPVRLGRRLSAERADGTAARRAVDRPSDGALPW